MSTQNKQFPVIREMYGYGERGPWAQPLTRGWTHTPPSASWYWEPLQRYRLIQVLKNRHSSQSGS